MKEERISIDLEAGKPPVSGIVMVPEKLKAMMILGHGAGAGMEHGFMTRMSNNLSAQNIGTLRYNFPYMEQGKRSPSAPSISENTVRAAVQKANQMFPDTILLAGGKSYGGRMTSQAQSKIPLAGVSGLIFFGFPLHAPGKPGDSRGAHLHDIDIPMLFLQGSRDKLADLSLLKPLLNSLKNKSILKVIEGADHTFNMLKSATKTTDEVQLELAELTADWLNHP